MMLERIRLAAAREALAERGQPDGLIAAVTFVATLILVESLAVGPLAATQPEVASALFWIAMVFNVILTADAVIAFRNHQGQWGHMGLGTLVLVVNAALLWAYSLSCHACRHAVGGRLKHFSKHPARYWMWTQVSKLNAKHMQFAWLSLFWVLLTDLYIRLVASGAITDPRFF